MDMRTLLRIIAKRWIVVIPTILLVVAVGVSAAQKAVVKYEATGATLLLAPNNAFDPGNPYAEANPALNTTATALTRVLGTSVVIDELANQGLSTDFAITIDEKAPIMTIKATAATPELAIASVDGVQAQIEKQLTAKEDAVGAGPLARIGSDRIVVPNKADKLLDDRNRAIVVMIVLGILAVSSVAILADSFARRRTTRRYKRVAPVPALQPAMAVVAPAVASEGAAAPPPAATPAVPPAATPVRPGSTSRPVTPRRRSMHQRVARRVAFTDPVWPEDWPDELLADGFDPDAFNTTPTAPPGEVVDVTSHDAEATVAETQTTSTEDTENPPATPKADGKPRKPAHLADPATADGASWIDSVAGALDSFSRRSGGRRRTPRRNGRRDGGSGGPPPREP